MVDGMTALCAFGGPQWVDTRLAHFLKAAIEPVGEACVSKLAR
jgi:hypothetical protein